MRYSLADECSVSVCLKLNESGPLKVSAERAGSVTSASNGVLMIQRCFSVSCADYPPPAEPLTDSHSQLTTHAGARKLQRTVKYRTKKMTQTQNKFGKERQKRVTFSVRWGGLIRMTNGLTSLKWPNLDFINQLWWIIPSLTTHVINLKKIKK